MYVSDSAAIFFNAPGGTKARSAAGSGSRGYHDQQTVAARFKMCELLLWSLKTLTPHYVGLPGSKVESFMSQRQLTHRQNSK